VDERTIEHWLNNMSNYQALAAAVIWSAVEDRDIKFIFSNNIWYELSGLDPSAVQRKFRETKAA
jgi:hypothetical protein